MKQQSEFSPHFGDATFTNEAKWPMGRQLLRPKGSSQRLIPNSVPKRRHESENMIIEKKQQAEKTKKDKPRRSLCGVQKEYEDEKLEQSADHRKSKFHH